MTDKKKLIKEISEQIEILSTIAIPREREAYKTYVSLANSSSVEHAKELFISLAKQEIEHERHLEDLKESLIKRVAELRKG